MRLRGIARAGDGALRLLIDDEGVDLVRLWLDRGWPVIKYGAWWEVGMRHHKITLLWLHIAWEGRRRAS